MMVPIGRSTPAVARPWFGNPALVLAVSSSVAIAVQADFRTPLQMPGHRGVLWLGLLVAVALLARRTGAATATGLASAALVLGVGAAPNGVLGVLPYVLAAVALDALSLVGAVRGRAWLLALLAAPVHLVALVVPLTRSVRVGVSLLSVLPGMTTVVLAHLAFGVVAGLVGWGLYRICDRGERPVAR